MSQSTDPESGSAYVSILGWGMFCVPLVYSPAGPGFLPLKRTVLFATLSIYAVAFAFDRRRTARQWHTAPFIYPGIVYASLAAASVFWAINPVSAVVETAQLSALLVLAILILNTLTLDDIPKLARYGAMSGGIVAILGILQHFGLDRWYLSTLGLEYLRIPSVGPPSGTFAFRNTTASYLIGSIPLAYLAWQTEKTSIRRWMWATSSCCMTLLLVYTRTRGAWVGLIAGVLLALTYLARQNRIKVTRASGRKTAAFVLGVLLLAGLASLEPDQRETTPQKFDTVKESAALALISIASPDADRGRLTYWKHTANLIADHPWLGVGYDNWEYYYPVYDRGEWIRSNSEPVRPHNDILWVWSELGIAGLLAFLGLILLPVYKVFRGTPGSDTEVAVTTACLVGAGALFVHGGFSFLREQPAASLLLWCSLVGLSIPQRRRLADAWSPAAEYAAIANGLLCVFIGIAHLRFDIGYAIALQQHNEGNFGPALIAIQDAKSQGMFDHRAAFLAGRTHQAAGTLSEARSAYEDALTYHPNYAHTHHNLGGVFASLGDSVAAETHYRRALEIRPTYHSARINYANALVRFGRLAEARLEVLKITEKMDSNAQAYALLGAIHLYEGSIQEGAKALEKAIGLNPTFAEPYNNLALAYEHLGRPRDAVEAYRNVERYWEGSPGYLEKIREQIRRLEAQNVP